MPITGDTPRACFDEFREHIAQLVGKLVPTDPILRLDIPRTANDVATLRFENAPHHSAPIETNAGVVHLYISQSLRALERGKGFQLQTESYYYKIFSDAGTPAAKAEPVLRWEYERQQHPYEGPCCNHFQVGRVNGEALAPPLGTSKIDLNRAHLPTGWVLLESVFRFLIHDLEMRPPCGASWPEELYKSEKRFREEFTTRAFGPPKS